MTVFDDEITFQKLREEMAAVEGRPHNGYQDAARYMRLESEIEAVAEHMAREKQRAEHGEG